MDMREDGTVPSLYGRWQPVRYEDRCRLRLAELDAAAQELVSVCAQLGDVRAIYAFGSYAKRMVGPESDLDALIIRDTSLPRADRERDIRLAMTAVIGFDFLVVRPDEYEQVLPTTSFGRDILRDAVLLADFSPEAAGTQ